MVWGAAGSIPHQDQSVAARNALRTRPGRSRRRGFRAQAAPARASTGACVRP